MAAKGSISQMPLSLRRTLAVGPAFLPAESGPGWSDRGIHFLPEKVAAAELPAGQGLPASLPTRPGPGRPLHDSPLHLVSEVLSLKPSPADSAPPRLQNPFAALPRVR